MVDVVDWQAAADETLEGYKEVNKVATLNSITKGAYNPATGANAAGSTLSFAEAYIITPPASGGTVQAFDTRESGVNVEELRFVKMAAANLPREPEIGDSIEFDGATWRISGLTRFQPGTVALYFRIGVRQIESA